MKTQEIYMNQYLFALLYLITLAATLVALLVYRATAKGKGLCINIQKLDQFFIISLAEPKLLANLDKEFEHYHRITKGIENPENQEEYEESIPGLETIPEENPQVDTEWNPQTDSWDNPLDPTEPAPPAYHPNWVNWVFNHVLNFQITEIAGRFFGNTFQTHYRQEHRQDYNFGNTVYLNADLAGPTPDLTEGETAATIEEIPEEVQAQWELDSTTEIPGLIEEAALLH